MYILDTETVAELRKAKMKRGSRSLRAWAQSVDMENVYLSSLTLQELEIAVLLAERDLQEKGEVMRRWMMRHVLHHFHDRILPIDSAIALRAANVHGRYSQPLSEALIGATAYVHGLTVVTRSADRYKQMGVTVFSWGAVPEDHG